LQPSDAARLAEISELFKSHYAKGGCPVAEAGLGPRPSEISLRMEDGCQGFASSLAEQYVVDSRTGEVKDPLVCCI
jgi:hypothetical protein